jgi:hypothetical protein
VFVDDGTHVIRVELTASPTRATITLSRREDDVVLGTRTLETEDVCGSLAAPLSLVLALLVDLSAEDVHLHVPAPIERRAPAGTEVALTLGGGVELGLGARLTALTALGVSVAPLPFLVLAFEVAVQPFAEFGDTPSVTVSALRLITDLCGRLRSEEGHALDICGSTSLGGVLGRGRGVAVAHEALVGWVVLGGAVHARLAIDRTWSLGTILRVGANVLAPSFHVRTDEAVVPLSTAEPLEASASLIVGARWWP